MSHWSAQHKTHTMVNDHHRSSDERGLYIDLSHHLIYDDHWPLYVFCVELISVTSIIDYLSTRCVTNIKSLQRTSEKFLENLISWKSQIVNNFIPRTWRNMSWLVEHIIYITIIIINAVFTITTIIWMNIPGRFWWYAFLIFFLHFCCNNLI